MGLVAFLRKSEVLLRCPRTPPGQLPVVIAQTLGCQRKDSGADKILEGVVMDPHIGSVIVIAYFSIGPPDQTEAGGPVAVSESRPEDEFKSPQGLFHQSLTEQRALSSLSSELQKALYSLRGLDRLLGHVARVVPAAAVGKLQAFMLRVCVHMAEAMLARNRITAPLTEQEVYSFPRYVLQNTVPYRKPFSCHAACTDSVFPLLRQL